jgi:glycosyltransferase involved in cell wall biosynthesis
MGMNEAPINDKIRIAWLMPSLSGGNYWHPVFCEFSKIFKQTIVYTGYWAGFSTGFADTFQVQVVGQTSFVSTTESEGGYSRGFMKVSPSIIKYLSKFKPDVIFANAFSLWTILAVLFKPLLGWKLIIAYEGSSPNVDYRDSAIRTWLRRAIAKTADAFITNNQAGKKYLIQVLQAQENLVFHRPYEVPDAQALLQLGKDPQINDQTQSQRPIFLFIGQLVQRKGLEYLLQACVILESSGYTNYTLRVLGQGELRAELEAFSREHSLKVEWIGWIDYGSVGCYFQNADVFVLPSLEDTWGMVVLEAMVFGKPILCSQLVGAREMVVDHVNGFLFDPQEPEALAQLMRQFIDNPDLIPTMGKESQRLIAEHTPQTAAQFLAEVTNHTLKKT